MSGTSPPVDPPDPDDEEWEPPNDPAPWRRSGRWNASTLLGSEQIRAGLGTDVDALADRVKPAKIDDSQTGKVLEAVGSVRDRILGAADDAGSSPEHTDSGSPSVMDRILDMVRRNSIAIGLVAFGGGLVVASLIPASKQERDVVRDMEDSAQPLVEQAKSVAKEVGEHIKGSDQDAANAVKDTATNAAHTTKDEAKAAPLEVKDQAQQARHHISGT